MTSLIHVAKETSIISAAWIARLVNYQRIVVGLSGGLDSTVLLHALSQQAALAGKIEAVHIHHGLSPHADVWQSHCQTFCQQLAIPLRCVAISLHQRHNIEEAAREARYQALLSCISVQDCLLTAHHQDDQAETLLLHLFRGAGVKGLAGMHAATFWHQDQQEDSSAKPIFRPLLLISRDELLCYAQTQQLSWVDDESNTDVRFSRNFIRQQLIPVIRRQWPAVSQILSRTSELCQEAQANLEDLARMDYVPSSVPAHQLSLSPLRSLNAARLANVLRYWLQLNQVRLPSQDMMQRLLREVIAAAEDKMPEVRWEDVVVKRYRQCLYLYSQQEIVAQSALADAGTLAWVDFPQPLILPHHQGRLTAQLAAEGMVLNRQDKMEIRFRGEGETMVLHGQTKSLKKLMQTWGIPPWLRSTIPLLYIRGELAAVVPYAVSDAFYGRVDAQGDGQGDGQEALKSDRSSSFKIMVNGY